MKKLTVELNDDVYQYVTDILGTQNLENLIIDYLETYQVFNKIKEMQNEDIFSNQE